MDLILVFVLGFLASLLGSFVNGTMSLVTLSGLLAMGFSPLIAFSTYRAGAMSFMFGGLLKFLRSGHIVWEYVIPLTIISLIAEGLGTFITFSIPEEFFSKLLMIILLLFVPITLLDRKMGVVDRAVGGLQKTISYGIFFLSKIFSGIIPFGAGIYLTYIYVYGFGLTLLQTKGTSRIPGFFGHLSAFVVLVAGGHFELKTSLILVAGTLVGSYIGAHYTIKAGNKALRYLIVVSIFIALVVKLVRG